MRQSPYKGPPPSREDLIRVYVEGGVSLSEAGKQLGGASRTLVRRWLLEAGLRPRTISEAKILAEAQALEKPGELERRRHSAAEMRKGITAESRRKVGEKLRGRPGTMLGKKMSDEAKAKMRALWTDERREQFSEMQRGEKAHWYKHGQSRTPHQIRISGWRWKQLATSCYERDGYVCQNCGRDCSDEARKREGHRIQAHHVQPRRVGGEDVLENLTTLCMPCHMKVEWGTAHLLKEEESV